MANHDFAQWNGFVGRVWKDNVDVRDFIQNNYTPYDGDESFLAGPTDATNTLWGKLQELQAAERAKGGVLDMETEIVSSLTSYGPGYIAEETKDLEQIVGLQTDKPLKRAFMPYGGIKMAEQSCKMYGYEPSEKLHEIFTVYHKTHNQGVFDIYTPEIMKARHNKILTGLPDTYGRGRIVGDYRRVALYGIDYLIEKKQIDFANTNRQGMRRYDFQLREEITDQINALKGMKEMAASYGFDISKPAANAKEAAQWLYFGYLAAIKTQNGAAMSVGRVSTFLDIYFTRDLANGVITEAEAQEIIDHFTMKCRMVKFARIESYNQLFSGDPVWATLEVGGIGLDGRHQVTKTCYRFLHTLENMGPSPEPNLTVMYSSRLPESFKKYAAKISVNTSSIQYENDDVMRVTWGDDYSICCCVSATETGKELQFFGARANLAKCLLYAINGGIDEKSGDQVGPEYTPITSEYLDYDEVMHKFDQMMDWLAHMYVGALNMIHYMHDKYYYEVCQMALIDTHVRRSFATGIAGFSHCVDSLSAIKYAKVKAIRGENGVTTDFEIEGDFPRYGNDDDRADEIAVWLLRTFMSKLRHIHTYRDSEPTTSILTITSNVVYGKATGALPDGRPAGEPLSPGANPAYGAEKSGLIASLNSVAKLPYEEALDGISNTQTINPGALGHSEEERVNNLVNVLDGYFDQGAHHLNVNVFGKEKLIDAMEHPEKPEYANFTIRVSGYAVKFIDLTKTQQLDVIARTCHEAL
ncbi:MAG: formate C-acetyltransferase [Pseudobutyrivibrio sp.]|jgi:formate C-acetyltransferase|uniref:Formate acetyltransferase n=3 Tax=Pseudobutyrivibrio TaxID=46205 RepID=A0A2G3EE81_9FIRM|nr:MULTISPECIES: formate C-acetyltransferase [Pseudobutyrivibrio]MBE5904113.1 formate C-acetyltransferase [Pseudobutyrivibrio sp.]NEX00568.1 formate C-acetyltransferase [Pseudobutyrivibrio xylanivorans]PHU36054.1 formate C-acetyltransferase [Pseudobutyrivibrio ruminis]PHU41578.1 formate C-acetyltransferase [Pseudobutyrivibrio ruminis]SFR61042.1 formate C-acetyltransferase [Pseudobutyrivibrio sp. NOR37]